jgi:hypothetical protein
MDRGCFFSLADAPSPLARRIWRSMVMAGGCGLTAALLDVVAVMLSTGRAG